MTPARTRTTRTSLIAGALIACAFTLIFGALTRGWLHAEATADQRAMMGYNLATLDLGLVGGVACTPDDDCFGDRYYATMYRESREMRVSSRVAVVALLLAALLCASSGALVLAGRRRHVPTVATTMTIVIAGVSGAMLCLTGSSADSPLSRELGLEFRAGFAFYVTMIALAGAAAALHALPRRAPRGLGDAID